MEKRAQEEFLKKMGERAADYVPEWHFDPSYPDLGTTLALVFAGMQQDTEHKRQQLPAKWKTEFFNRLRTCPRPEEPALGYVCFGLVNDEVEGTELPARTALTTQAVGDDGEPVPVETREDVFVSPARLEAVYESSDRRDCICRIFDGEHKKNYRLFEFAGANIQEHEWYMGCRDVFPAELGEEIQLSLWDLRGNRMDRIVLEELLEKAEFCYSSAQGYQPFASQSAAHGSLVFVKGADQPAWTETELGGKDICWLRCRFTHGRLFTSLAIQDVRVSARASMIAPDSIYAGGMDTAGKGPCYPFGEQPAIYDELYFSNDEALRKRGAVVELSFLREFVKIPLNIMETAQIQWKLIMPKSAVRVEREYDITVSGVIWEYFNGNGWKRLFPERQYEDVFGVNEGTHRQRKVLRFICPEDLSPAMVNGVEGRCIRARIMKLDNEFKTLGQYITPVLSEIYFEYYYEKTGVRPEYFFERNNMRDLLLRTDSCLNQGTGYYPVKLYGDREDAVYLGFTAPFPLGPVRILAVMGAYSHRKRPPLRWQYWGDGRFRDLNPADETENFMKSGLISFNALPDFQKSEHFGRSLYWMRIQDLYSEYGGRERGELPYLEGLYMNGVKAWTVKTGMEDTFTLEDYESEPKFQFLSRPVCKARVWVDETDTLSEAEARELEKEQRLFKEKDGESSKTWVMWTRAEEFSKDAGDGRCYILDSSQGLLEFSGHGGYRLPAPGVGGGIWVQYSVGGGESANLKEHQVDGLERSVGFISQVDNPLPFFGGLRRESPDEAMSRSSQELKHRFRAVTAGDYEKLAAESSKMVCRAFCFSGYGEDGIRRPGHVTLVLLQKDFRNSFRHFPMLKETVLSYMRDKVFVKLIEKNRLHMVMPDFVGIQVRVELYVENFNVIFQCRKLVMERLEQFLNPITGNTAGNGFKAGILPGRGQIDMVIKSVDMVKEVRNLVVTGRMNRGCEMVEVNLDDRGHHPYVLPMNGEHQIIVKAL